jgi:hypothetical protein
MERGCSNRPGSDGRRWTVRRVVVPGISWWYSAGGWSNLQVEAEACVIGEALAIVDSIDSAETVQLIEVKK